MIQQRNVYELGYTDGRGVHQERIFESFEVACEVARSMNERDVYVIGRKANRMDTVLRCNACGRVDHLDLNLDGLGVQDLHTAAQRAAELAGWTLCGSDAFCPLCNDARFERDVHDRMVAVLDAIKAGMRDGRTLGPSAVEYMVKLTDDLLSLMGADTHAGHAGANRLEHRQEESL